MTRLIRVYPQRWRDRYEAEVMAILEVRPPTFRDRLDIVRGAIDAHLHPGQIDGGTPIPWTNRIPGLLALTGGLMWAGPVVASALLGTDPGAQGLIGSSVILMAVSLSGEYAVSYGRRIGIVVAILAVALLGAAPFGWSAFAVALFGGYLVVGAGMLTLAAIRAGIGTRGRWAIITGTMLVPLSLLVPIVVRSPTQPSFTTAVAVILPFGLAWVLLGARMLIRGAPTFVDPPDPVEPELCTR